MPISQKKPQQISLTVLLASAIGGLVFVSIAIVLALSEYTSYVNTTQLLKRSANQLIDSIEDHVRSHIDPVRFVAEHIKKQVITGQIDLSDTYEMTLTQKAAMAGVPNISGVVTWQNNGSELLVGRRNESSSLIVERKQAFEDPAFKAHFQALTASTPPNWQKPWRFGRSTLITYSTGIFKGQEKLGAVGAGISLTRLSAVIAKLEEGSNLTGFILYDKDKVLAHRTLPDLSTKKISKASPLFAASAIKDGVLGKFAAAKPRVFKTGKVFETRNVRVGGKVFVTVSRPVRMYGDHLWHIGVYAPRSELLAQLRRLVMSFVAALVILIAAVVASVILARRLARPVKAVSTAATHIGSLELEAIKPLPGSHIREINQQATAFNQMLEGLKWFEAYVPRRLVKKLIRHHDDEDIASREQVLTVMFTDIIGFTAMSENLSPQATADLLNGHFEVINQAIEKSGGTIDKYIGDAVMAFWGAPDKQDDHAVRACQAAVAIRDGFAGLDNGLRIKIAIHTGALIVGNIGAASRMNYTVIGDTVNTCSRIEGLAGEIDDGGPATIVVSQVTADLVEGKFELKNAGQFKVKGRRQTVNVHKIIGAIAPTNPKV